MDLPEYPKPIIWGPEKPALKLRLGRGGGQHPESSTNENLFLRPTDFDDNGTFTLEKFLDKSQRCAALHGAEQCPLVAHDIPNPAYGMDDYEPEALPIANAQVNPDGCPGLCFLRDRCTQGEGQPNVAEQRFLWRYIAANAWPAPSDWTKDLGRDLRHYGLRFPALIPQVWLNLFDRIEDREREPSRVDFVMFAERRRCVIEIDGPSHYAEFRRGHYQVSERLYTKNLRVERALRRKGWDMFRFSNWEVVNASDEDFADMVEDLPGSRVMPF